MDLTELAPNELSWLESRTPGDGFAGYNATGWDDSISVLHAMYENPNMPPDVTYDDEARGETPPERKSLFEPSIGKMQLIGCPGGESRSPGPDWKRLPWVTLAERQNIQLFRDGRYPYCGTFRFHSWPLSIRPPAEGSLDWEQLEAVVEHLSTVTETGMHATCYAFFSPLRCRDWNDSGIYWGTMSALLASYDSTKFFGSPSNFWPADRSWMVYTDSDGWATKISGSTDLIASLIADRRLETVRIEESTAGSSIDL